MTIEKIAAAIDYLVAHYQDQPGLQETASRFGYEATAFQKSFQQYVGLSPKKFVQYLSMRHARDFLLQGGTTLDAAYAAGLSGNGRLHDLFVTFEAASPGEVRGRGAGMVLTYGFHSTPLGEIMISTSERGICWIGFQVDESRASSLARMRRYWRNAELIENYDATVYAADALHAIWRGNHDARNNVRLHVHGTNFQMQVWQAMLKIPSGSTVSYKAIAEALDMPRASRAVGNAVGANPVSWLIPCHRVIQESGIIDNYGWGSPRKKALLSVEMASLNPV